MGGEKARRVAARFRRHLRSMAEATPTYCPRNPEVETNLRCGRCGELICPDCLIQTDVGSRCSTCAAVRTLPMFAPSGVELGRAVLAAFGMAFGLAVAYVLVVWFVLPANVLFSVVAIGGIGWLAGEVTHRASGYKRSQSLQWVAGGATLVGYAVITIAQLAGLGGIVGLLLGTFYAIQKVKPPRS